MLGSVMLCLVLCVFCLLGFSFTIPFSYHAKNICPFKVAVVHLLPPAFGYMSRVQPAEVLSLWLYGHQKQK